MDDDLKAAEAAIKAAEAGGDPEEIARARSRLDTLKASQAPAKARRKSK